MHTALDTLCKFAYEVRLNESGVNEKRVRVGQVVYVRSSGKRVPWIAVVKRIRNGSVRMEWYYRPDDLPPRALIGHQAPAHNELFRSTCFDDNPVSTIIGPCAVSASSSDENAYFCTRLFTGELVC